MKKRFSLLLCLIMAAMMLTACGKRQKAAEKVEIIPTETPAPTDCNRDADCYSCSGSHSAADSHALCHSGIDAYSGPNPPSQSHQKPGRWDCPGKRGLRIYCAM